MRSVGLAVVWRQVQAPVGFGYCVFFSENDTRSTSSSASVSA